MPTYEYKCENCGLRFERRQSMSAEPIAECPDCHGKVHRLITGGSGFIFKGSGSAGASGPGDHQCSFEKTGSTCCGRDERCGKTSCEA